MSQNTVVAPPPGPPAAYEFSKTENATISRTAKWAKAVAVMFFITTAVQVVNLNILGILVDLAIGVTFWKGATLLDAVVNTEGDDVPNMLGALDQLQTAFTIRILITAIAAAIALVVSVGVFIQYKFLYDPADVEPAVSVDDAQEQDDADEGDDATPDDAAQPEGSPADAPAEVAPEEVAPEEPGEAAPEEPGEAAPLEADEAPPT